MRVRTRRITTTTPTGVPACYRGARTRAAIRIDGARGRGPEQCRKDVCGRSIRTARTTNRDAAVVPLPADLAARALELDQDGIRLDTGSLRDGAVADRHAVTGRGVLRAGPGSTAIGAGPPSSG